MPRQERTGQPSVLDNDISVGIEVEAIIDSKVIKGKQLYLLRWKGYDSSNDTWEPAENLSCPELLSKYESSQRRLKTSPQKVRVTSEGSNSKSVGGSHQRKTLGRKRRAIEIENSFSCLQDSSLEEKSLLDSTNVNKFASKEKENDNDQVTDASAGNNKLNECEESSTSIFCTPTENETQVSASLKVFDETLKALEKTGFQRGYEPERILGAVERSDGVHFIIKWENFETIDLVTPKEMKENCPKMLIDFYRKHLRWCHRSSAST